MQSPASILQLHGDAHPLSLCLSPLFTPSCAAAYYQEVITRRELEQQPPAAPPWPLLDVGYCCPVEACSTVGYYIPASPTARNITVTTCITMSHDPASVDFGVDPSIVVYESDASCGIASDALLCGEG